MTHWKLKSNVQTVGRRVYVNIGIDHLILSFSFPFLLLLSYLYSFCLNYFAIIRWAFYIQHYQMRRMPAKVSLSLRQCIDHFTVKLIQVD